MGPQTQRKVFMTFILNILNSRMFDLVVVGGGSGGLALSKRAACLYGKKVLLIDKTVLGGTCVNSGCIPKKMLYNAASIHAEARKLRREEVEFNWDEFRVKREAYISFLNSLYEKRNEKDGIEVVTGKATVHKDRVEVNKTEYKGKNIAMAMGSYPVKINCPGAEVLLTSDDFFRFESVPKSVAIIGTGYISIETAFVLAEFNCQVTLIARREGVLRSFDTMIQEKVERSLKSKGIRLIESANIIKILPKTNENKNHTIEIQNKHTGQIEEVSVEKIICAIGRKANTSSIVIPDIKKDENGFIETDNEFKTSADRIYAIGDMTMSDYMLTPVAIFSGRRLADYLFGSIPGSIKRLVKSVPTIIFSHPPAGSVGYSEEEASGICRSVSVSTVEISHQLSLFSDEVNSYKFVYENESGEILGIHIYGLESDEVLQGFSVLVRNSTKYSEISSYLSFIGSTENELLSGRFE